MVQARVPDCPVPGGCPWLSALARTALLPLSIAVALVGLGIALLGVHLPGIASPAIRQLPLTEDGFTRIEGSVAPYLR